VAKFLARVLVILLLQACAQVTETLPPIDHYSVATSPELESIVVSWLQAFQEQETNTILHLETLSPTNLLNPEEIENADLIVTANLPPEDWFATPLLRQSLSVIVHPSNEVTTLTWEDLGDIFSGRVFSWAAVGGSDEAIQPVIPLDGERSREVFKSVVLPESSFTLNSLLAPNQEFIRDLVGENPGGIGFILSSQMSDNVSQLVIEEQESDLNPISDPEHILVIEILAIAQEEPTGTLREFLVWLQGTYLP
jgi:DNA-binding transcriptional LysR family regulator